MADNTSKKGTILIADDTDINRELLADMLEDEYNILEAVNGTEALELIMKHKTNISLVLLDIVMPEKDGFEVLGTMNAHHLTTKIPVIIISAEAASPYIERGYKLGAVDYITRPFSKSAVRHRIITTITAYSEKAALQKKVYEQIVSRERNDTLMVSVLANVVEFRNGESGLHVLHVNTITEILLRHLMMLYPKYHFTASQISAICTASSIHDIGKIAVPEEILNKPGKLTDSEFAIMKSHSEAGAAMIASVKGYEQEPMMKYAYEICRWHHERWDGSGYPDGISGDEIPIYVQAVSMADVYDALTSARVYKDAYDHKTAVRMIKEGECGSFNPELLHCFTLCEDRIEENMKETSIYDSIKRRSEDAIQESMYEESSFAEF